MPVYHLASGIFSPLGANAEEACNAIKETIPGIRNWSQPDGTSYFGAKLSAEQEQQLQDTSLSPLEMMSIHAVNEALSKSSVDAASPGCIFIFSTTKGNIEWLGRRDDHFISLHYSASRIAKHYQNPNKPIVVSNACISGSLALLMAKRLLDAGKYKHAIVVGADRLTGFVLDGFKSFQAIAPEPCRPFDRDRKGINLGEAAACMILSSQADKPLSILSGAAVTNDANHLSGPSRTGAELGAAITAALQEAGVQAHEIEAISAHGTATLYNDEMEAKALNLSGVAHAPLYSLKAYTGHTLGAAGILESAVACTAMQQSWLPASPGYEHSGVSEPVNVQQQMQYTSYKNLLKTASGFGGCNAALVWQTVP